MGKLCFLFLYAVPVDKITQYVPADSLLEDWRLYRKSIGVYLDCARFKYPMVFFRSNQVLRIVSLYA